MARFTSSTIVRAGIRHHRRSLAGVFVAVLAAGCVATGLGVLVESGLRGGVEPQRLVAVDVVVGGRQDFPVPGDIPVVLAERAPLPPGTAEIIAALPVVSQVIPDLTIPMVLGDTPVEAHGWASADLTPYRIVSGRPPSTDGDIVVTSNDAAALGATVTLWQGGVAADYRVVGIAAAASEQQPDRAGDVFLSDRQAAELGPHAGTPTLLGVLPRPGVSADELATLIHQHVPEAATYIGRERGDAEFLDAGNARNTLVVTSLSFAGIAILVALMVVAGTLSLSIQTRRRDFALLRAVGSTPGQIHRLVGREVLMVAGPAAVIGVFPGYLLAYLLRYAFGRAGVIPPDFDLTFGAVPALGAVALMIATSQVAAAVAARRSARINPVEALQESSTTPSHLGRGRTIAGVTLGVIGVAVSALPLVIHGQAAIAGPAASVVLIMIAVGLLGPRLVHAAMSFFSTTMRRSSSPAVFLAAANTHGNSRRLAAAITPLALGIALGLVQIGTQSVVTAEADTQSRAGVVADLIVTGGPSGLGTAGLADIAGEAGVLATNPVSVSQAVLSYRELGEPVAQAFALQGVDPQALSSTMDLGVDAGSFDHLTGSNTVALSTDTARTVGVDVGDTVQAHLGDGTPLTTTVVATYQRGLGFGDITMTNAAVRAHTTTGGIDYVLVSTDDGATAEVQKSLTAAGFTVTDRSEHTSGEKERSQQSWVNLIALGVILGYIAIAVVNTLVMATSSRRREFALLQLIGSTPRQVRSMMRTESAMVALTAAVLGVLVAVPPLVGISLGVSGQPVPHLSLLGSATIIGALCGLGLAALARSTRTTLRARPISEIGSRE